jgi:hypothetical protein
MFVQQQQQQSQMYASAGFMPQGMGGYPKAGPPASPAVPTYPPLPPPTAVVEIGPNRTANVQLSWQSGSHDSDQTALYELQLRGGRDADWRTAYVGSFTKHKVAGLFQGTRYFARVRRVRAGGGEYGEPVDFTTPTSTSREQPGGFDRYSDSGSLYATERSRYSTSQGNADPRYSSQQTVSMSNYASAPGSSGAMSARELYSGSNFYNSGASENPVYESMNGRSSAGQAPLSYRPQGSVPQTPPIARRLDAFV